MADVYQFKVKLKELPKVIWRDIEITSTSTVAKLAYAVLAAFEANATHLFGIDFKGVHYEIPYEEDTPEFDKQCKEFFKELCKGLLGKIPEEVLSEDFFAPEPTADPTKTKLSELKLSKGDILHMEYDFGAGWEFSIKLTRITEMKKGTGTHYPYIINGQGKGIIENMFPFKFAEMIKETNETGKIPKIYNAFSDNGVEWDYNDFDLKYYNTFFKNKIREIQSRYER